MPTCRSIIYATDDTLPPAEQLAVDDSLFFQTEKRGGETLRIWEPREPMVVLGRGNKVEREVLTRNCRADGVPVLRRSSGGGAVVLMPGCLCYALILDQETDGELFSARSTNQTVLDGLAGVFADLAGTSVEVRGDSDLVMAERKIAGNAQRRGRRAVLLHGCLLLAADLSLMNRYLAVPSRRPEYRGDRSHEDFVSNAGWAKSGVEEGLKEWFRKRRSA